jgi:hypothetical protein
MPENRGEKERTLRCVKGKYQSPKLFLTQGGIGLHYGNAGRFSAYPFHVDPAHIRMGGLIGMFVVP